ncbi:hypothetical protein Tco_0608093 [Tanacetum coccineum]
MLYGSECWSITKAQAKKVEVAEPRLLRWLCGKTRFDMIPNGVFREKHKVKNIISKMREKRLRWFGHVKRRLQTAPLRSMEALIVEALGRMDRIAWRGRIRIDRSHWKQSLYFWVYLGVRIRSEIDCSTLSSLASVSAMDNKSDVAVPRTL